ncbi:hypothetical protein B9G98_00805 [Wickerhamiella sorbophila]|uniref:N-acetyltransferase domain-containing protein n=1 Tax=Wickerhamiella sorbophila TaxID=45607 RepID=A0A2T0FDZ6_9ASCO|nr:hypothetical protein B9G98_00805 [Wickerhamiella sorbophila]PRT53185.1 hypothetical protein B9G98_00805 [Wickerhamiella sorbophila]
MRIHKVVPEETRFSDALEIARFLLQAFQGDQTFRVLLGPLYFPPLPTRSTYYYNKVLLYLAFRWWIIIRDGSTCSWKLLGPDDQLVGFCSWVLPASMKPTQSWWQQFSNSVLNAIFHVLRRMISLGDGYQSLSARKRRLGPLFQEIDDEIGWLKVDRTKLARLDQHALSESLYHRDDIWWCTTMAIDPEHQRKGLGYTLFNHSLEHLEPFYPVFSDGGLATTGPAKYGLCASEDGRNLYVKSGFTHYQTCRRKLEGEELLRSIYFRTLF